MNENYMKTMDEHIKDCYLYLLISDEESDDDITQELDELAEEKLLIYLATQCITSEERGMLKCSTERRITRFNDRQFENSLGVNRSVAVSLSERFERTKYYRSVTESGRASLSATNHLYVFLWFLRHQNASYRDVARVFAVSLSTVYGTLQRVARFLTEELSREVLHWPNACERRISADNYLERLGTPGVVAVVGRLHIDTSDQMPPTPFIALHAVCNDEDRFLHINFASSEVAACDENAIQITWPPLNDDEFVLGAVCYAHLPHVRAADTEQSAFIEEQLKTCFQRVQDTFRQLHCFKIRNHNLQTALIHSCFILYNFNYYAELSSGVVEHSYMCKSKNC